MSGDFVQRGTPAWTDKYLRTKMALLNQADLVFEMPVVYASSSAETFASCRSQSFKFIRFRRYALFWKRMR